MNGDEDAPYEPQFYYTIFRFKIKKPSNFTIVLKDSNLKIQTEKKRKSGNLLVRAQRSRKYKRKAYNLKWKTARSHHVNSSSKSGPSRWWLIFAAIFFVPVNFYVISGSDAVLFKFRSYPNFNGSSFSSLCPMPICYLCYGGGTTVSSLASLPLLHRLVHSLSVSLTFS